MASNPNILVLFLLSFTILALADEAPDESLIHFHNKLCSNSYYHPSSWLSSSGHFAFGFYPQGDGYAVGIWLVIGSTQSDNTVVWTANRDDPPVSSSSTLQLTKDGLLLLLQGREEKRKHIADLSELDEAAASASMLDSGNFVIYGQGEGKVIWQSFDYPTDTILGGQNLTRNNKLVSSMSKSNHSSGHHLLASQTLQSEQGYVDYYFEVNYNLDEGYDKLVAYPVNSLFEPDDAYWASMAIEGLLSQLGLNIEGSLCVTESQCLHSNANLGKRSQNTTSIYRATLDVDGNFRLYEHQFEAELESDTMLSVKKLWQALPDICQIKGFCGLNSYCSNSGGEAVCACYPGFVPSENGSNMFLDCKLNYSKDDCEKSADDRTLLYNVTSLEEMSWDVYPYSVITSITMEACEKSCKEDCDCAAALYAGGSCSKCNLPLRYGKRVPNTPSTALFKVHSSGYVTSLNQTVVPPKKPKVDSPKKPEVVIDNKRSLTMILASTLGSISLISVVFAVSIFFIYRRQVYRHTKLSTSSNIGFTEECSLRSFSFDELVKATSGFTEVVGRGSFGAVYGGTVGESRKRVAVMRMERIADDEGERKFRAEIIAIARTHHRNLVKLIGYCIDGSRKLLVYEYLSNGSLANLLFKAKKHYLPWNERLKIALDVARGVQYLHEECGVHIIHCNLKPQNILMDEMWTAKISDFGFARLLKPAEDSRTKTGDQGTRGYLAPEWKKEASVSVNADIYSYGVVLLEIVCRRRGIEVHVSSPEEILLSSWVYQCFATEQLNKLVASGAEKEEEEEEDVDVIWKILERMVMVGLWCVQDDPILRPSMKNVILMLEGWKDIPIPPPPSV